jgi:hypothetical protein
VLGPRGLPSMHPWHTILDLLPFAPAPPPARRDIPDSVFRNDGLWRQWYDQEAPEMAKVGGLSLVTRSVLRATEWRSRVTLLPIHT